ncbi:hypothetical protein [Endozoicomonas montiporae]|nr:hypothetical protein [Endozoicomonas montiporae]
MLKDISSQKISTHFLNFFRVVLVFAVSAISVVTQVQAITITFYHDKTQPVSGGDELTFEVIMFSIDGPMVTELDLGNNYAMNDYTGYDLDNVRFTHMESSGSCGPENANNSMSCGVPPYSFVFTISPYDTQFSNVMANAFKVHSTGLTNTVGLHHESLENGYLTSSIMAFFLGFSASSQEHSTVIDPQDVEELFMPDQNTSSFVTMSKEEIQENEHGPFLDSEDYLSMTLLSGCSLVLLVRNNVLHFLSVIDARKLVRDTLSRGYVWRKRFNNDQEG